ncbi:long-chain fatty acid--CoA ligase [Ferrovibrio sp.]|uniref:AMP-dependent synthetase/ligase n=1 Tax=Ferrovibrio sp. TaxID=1917215 RepID=UPI000CB2AE24|nr:AMP-binding protein [Ferrovibrio sp.]PJI40921.1 MAG: acyl-CoA synthetase [Ferrovibrio sp.]
MTTLRATPVKDTRMAAGRTLPQLLRDRVREFGGRPAIRSKRAGIWRNRDWSDVNRLVRLCARGLAASGLKRGEVLALVSENLEEQFLLELGALCLGARTVSAYPDASVDELGYLLEHSEAAMVVGEDQEQIDKILTIMSRAPAIRAVFHIDGRGLWDYKVAALVSLETLLERGATHRDDAWLDAEIDLGRQEDVAVYCYTSGTTGRPKGAMLSHAFILDNAYRLMGSLGVEPAARYLSYISPAWAAEQYFGIGLALLAPMILYYAEKPETVQHDLREVGPEYLMFTPRQWEMLASGVEARMMDAGVLRRALFAWGLRVGRARLSDKAGFFTRHMLAPLADMLILRGVRDLLGLSKVRGVLSGGSGLSAELFMRFHAFGVPLGNLYGSTELGLVSSHRRGTVYRPETMGELMPCDPSIAGSTEAWVDGSSQLRLRLPAFSGYLKNEEASKELGNAEDGYATGDAVRIDENGQLIFLDRLKDMRRLRTGQAYPPQFFENHLRAASMVRDAIVIGDASHDFVTALVNIDSEIAGRFAELHGLAYGTFTELSQLPAIRSEIAAVIAAVNRLVDPGARVLRFATLPKELDADESELTRSRKLRREAIHERYENLIDSLYRGASHCDSEIQVKYQDGSVSRLRARVAVNVVEAAS